MVTWQQREEMVKTSSRGWSIKNISIKTRLVFLVSIMTFGTLLILGKMYVLLEETNIGSKHYSDIILSKDLLADILPPPEYIIEARLLTLELEKAEDAEAQAIIEKLKTLHEDYKARQAYWKQHLTINDEARTLILKTTQIPAEHFFATVNSELIPAYQRGDIVRVAELNSTVLHQDYLEHRAGIDKLVALANKMATELEQIATDTDKSGKTEVAIWFVVLSIVILGFVSWVILTINRRLQVLHHGIIGMQKGQGKITLDGDDEITLLVDDLNSYIGGLEAKANEDKVFIKELEEVLGYTKYAMYGYLVNSETKDETLNTIKTLLNETLKRLNSDIDQALTVLTHYGNAKFDYKINIDGISGKTGSLILSLRALGSSVSELLAVIDMTSMELGSSIATLTTNANKLSASSNQQAASLEETAAALEEMTGTITSNFQNIDKMASFASMVTQSSNSGQLLATQTGQSMDEINNQVNAINDAITVIDQISFQTNILSLNAAVEAATAGEAGKGFAVVAGEVRNLANRSAEAAREIKNLVATAKAKTDEGKEIANNMITGYTELNRNIENTISLINSVKDASNEQQVGIKQINIAISELDSATQQNAHAANDISELAKSVETLSNKLTNFVKNSSYDVEAKSSACDVDVMFKVNSLKLDHVNFKNNNYGKLGTKTTWQVPTAHDCNLGKWIDEQEKAGHKFTKTDNWNKMKQIHHDVHNDVQKTITHNHAGEMEKVLECAIKTDKNISNVFFALNQVKRDNC